ncbi:hypothetical protein DCO46_20345 [Flavobacterium sp. HTF]|nr:hypothetical protein DCO46_20345 [Flavobacterium sp. HTF]
MMNFPIIMSITSGAAFLLGFLLLAHLRKVNFIANTCLGLFIITLGLEMIEIPLFYNNFNLRHPNLYEMIGLSRFLTAPLLYFSILYFTSVNKKFEYKMLWHFLPFVFFFIFRIPFFITGKNIEFSPQTARMFFFVLQMTLPVQALIYWLVSFVKLHRHLRNLRQISSSTEQNDLVWLKYFLLILLLIIVVWFNLIFFNLGYLIQFTPFTYLLSVFFLAYFSMQQNEIFDFTKSELNELSSIVSKKESPKRVAGKRLKELDEKLRILTGSEKVYLENDLSLPKLAQRLDASCNETSFVINELYQDNFYNYINRYRIEEAKSLLLSNKYYQLNILGIAYESGFNSKTTFNTTFKKFTGMSPTQFVKANGVLTKDTVN